MSAIQRPSTPYPYTHTLVHGHSASYLQPHPLHHHASTQPLHFHMTRMPQRVPPSLLRDTRDPARSPHLHLLVCLLPSAPHHTAAPAHLDRAHTPHTPAVGHVPGTARSSGGAFTSRPRAAGQVTVTRQCMASRSGGRGGEGQEAIRRAGDEVQA
ncbi:hypothetical protein AYX15_02887 [Cryptococcus neoformans]|nr:hypothetical protein AYX15_02887 [Cryptococcus neoformans var. grubii]